MFIISCKYTKTSNHIINLVSDIRKYHDDEKILVVDSDSSDKTYFNALEKYNAEILDVANQNWMVGAYWKGFFKYPNENFYYCFHDSMRVKDNLDYLKQKELTMLATFNRTGHISFNAWNKRINTETKYKVTNTGYGCYGPIFMISNRLFTNLYNNNAHVLLPANKAETGFMEGAFGALFECEGFNLMECSLYGDILEQESPGGKSYPQPFYTGWQYPIEKFYASHIDNTRKL